MKSLNEGMLEDPESNLRCGIRLKITVWHNCTRTATFPVVRPVLMLGWSRARTSHTSGTV